MIARAEHPFEPIGLYQIGEAIKIGTKARARFLCMDQADLDARFNQVIE